MRHGIKKIKSQLGIDANQMLMRKLATNFLGNGILTTTEKKARMLKTHIEKLVEKTKENSQANRNFLLRNLGNSKLVDSLFSSVGTVMNKKIGGYVTMQKLFRRESDGALMIKIAWTEPIVMANVKVEKAAIVEETNSKSKKTKKS